MKKLLFLMLMVSFVIIQMNKADAGDRKVLIERFTSSTCGPCASNNPSLDAFLSSADPNKVVSISYHMNWPPPGNDPMYLINPNDNNARRTIYGVNAIPNWWFDGAVNLVGGNISQIQNAFNSRTDILSPVTIIVTENVVGTNVTVKADIYCEGLIAVPTVYIHIAVLEKLVQYSSPPGTNGETQFHDVMRKLVTGTNGVAVNLLPGAKTTVQFSYELDPTWNESQVRNLVFVQSTPTEILNVSYATENFNLYSAPGFRTINQGQAGNENFKVYIPSVANGYNSPVSFTSEVIPANAGINVQFPQGHSINNFPDSLSVNVSSTSSVPTGEYKIVLTGTNTNGIVHKTIVNYLVGKNYISVGTTRTNSLAFKVDNLNYNSARAFLWDIGSTHTLEAVSPQTFGNVRYIFSNWSNGGSQSHTITIGTSVTDYRASFRVQYRVLGAVQPVGLPVTLPGANTYYDSASAQTVSLSALQAQFEGRTYYFQRWEGTGSGSYSGSNPVANITMNGFVYQKAIFDTINVGISNYNSLIPDEFALYQNYPNPFNPSTNIKFDIARSSMTSIKVYDMLGKEVMNPVNQVLNAGSYQFDFNASGLPSGIYYYRIQTEYFNDVKKMMLIK